MSESKVVFQPSQTTHWRNLFPNKTMLLGSHNLNEGEELVAEMISVSIEEIRDQKGAMEQVPVLRFVNAPPMVLNITNTKVIAGIYGDSYAGWEGESIQVFATLVRAFGQEQMALRVRNFRPHIEQDVSQYVSQLQACKTMKELQSCYLSVPKHLRSQVVGIKDEMKGSINAQA